LGFRAFGTGATSIPDLHDLVAFRHKQDEAMIAVRSRQQKQGAGLLESCQVKEIAMLAIVVMHIAVANELGCGRNERDAVFHLFDETFAAPLEHSRIEFVSH
jgi:hypothetical protein